MVAPPAPAWVRWAKRRRPESGPAPPPAETASLERKIPFQLSAQLWTRGPGAALMRSEEHTSELQSLMRISYAVFCLKKKNKYNTTVNNSTETADTLPL